jgi:NAD dependent epimerase/dehydratase family enzyme
MLSVHISPLQFVSWIPVHDVVLYLRQLFDELGCSGRIGSSYYTSSLKIINSLSNHNLTSVYSVRFVVSEKIF